MEFSSDDSTLLSIDSRRHVRLWDLESRSPRWDFDEETAFDSVTFAPDGQHVLISPPPKFLRHDYPVVCVLLNVRTGAAYPAPIQFGFAAGRRDLLFSPDGTRCVAQDGSGNSTSVLSWWEYPSGRLLPTWFVKPLESNNIGALAFSPDGRKLAGMSLRGVHVYDVASGALRFVHPFEVGQSQRLLAFHPDGRLLAVGSGTQLVVLDLESCQEIAELRLPNKNYQQAAFTPDGRFLATVSRDETVLFWETSAWYVAQEYAWGIGDLTCLAFDREGFRAAAGSEEKKVVVWDLDE